ncbi:MAG: helix-turn-helix domain-containing protein [Deltaproteobacteria bacterium]|nr:helix-turn-helix domain-containing protein [Deltaproteobacteria bacterium]
MILVQVSTLADRLGVHRNTIRNWVKTGRIPARPAPGRGLILAPEDFRRLCEDFALDPASLNPRELAMAPAAPSRREAPVLSKPQKPLVNSQPEPEARLPIPLSREAVMSDKVVGSVMVVGGGIAGIQAALDLADSGYYVYLVEKGPGIGGKMAQLDKTYPTNDCAM